MAENKAGEKCLVAKRNIDWSARKLSAIIVGFLFLASVTLITAHASTQIRAPDFLRKCAVPAKLASLLASHPPTSVMASVLAITLRLSISLNPGSQSDAAAAGAIQSGIGLLQSNRSFASRQGAFLLREIIRENSNAKDLLSQAGGLSELAAAVEEGSSEGTTAAAAETFAVFAADANSARKTAALKAGAVKVLLEHLEAKSSRGSKSETYAAWAVANLAANSPQVQGALTELGGAEIFTELLQRGGRTLTTQAAIFGVANLADRNTAAQDLLRDLGVVKSLVQIVNASTGSHKSRASEPFHVEILEHVAELQRRDPSVRAALAEVGGLEELLALIQSDSGLKPPGDGRSKQLILAEEDDEEGDELHSVRRLVRDLQDEVDAEAGILQTSWPSLSRRASGGSWLSEPSVGSWQSLASQAAWALGNAIANNPESQNHAREAGAAEALVTLLESAEDAKVAKGALGAISALVKGNAANKAAVREAHGVQGLVKLLASNPTDKEVLKATAAALKSMTAEKPALQFVSHSGHRIIRVLGLRGSLLLSEFLGLQISAGAVSAVLASVFALSVVISLIAVFKILNVRSNSGMDKKRN